jgi:hypothetical protein
MHSTEQQQRRDGGRKSRRMQLARCRAFKMGVRGARWLPRHTPQRPREARSRGNGSARCTLCKSLAEEHWQEARTSSAGDTRRQRRKRKNAH